MEDVKISSIGDYKQRKNDHLAKEKGLRVKTEITCEGPVGKDIHNILKSELENLGCTAYGFTNPDWVISIIAFSHYDMVELSIILRRLFRSTSPGSELEGWDNRGKAILKDGAWLYESLRFHGLYGIKKMELVGFLKGLIGEFKHKHWNLQYDHQPSNAGTTVNS